MQRRELGAYSDAYFKDYCNLNKSFYENSWTETWRLLIMFLEDCMFCWTFGQLNMWGELWRLALNLVSSNLLGEPEDILPLRENKDFLPFFLQVSPLA